jgi:hypothetical protein
VTKEKGLAARLSIGLGVAALLYLGRTCALFAAGLLVFAVVEQAWGAVGVVGMACLVGSAACGIATGVYLKRDGEVGRLVLVAVGATVLMFLGAVLVAIQLR